MLDHLSDVLFLIDEVGGEPLRRTRRSTERAESPVELVPPVNFRKSVQYEYPVGTRGSPKLDPQ
jgi:hypothetical protein